APTTEELLVGLYEYALPALATALAEYRRDTNPLTDAPSLRLCRFAALEVDDMIALGAKCCACLVDDETRTRMAPWLALLRECLDIIDKFTHDGLLDVLVPA